MVLPAGVMFAQLVLVTVDDRITDVARYIREPASLLVLVVIIVWLVVSLDGKDPGRNVFTNGRGTGSFLSLVLVLAFSVGLGLFDLDIASPVALLIALAVIGLAGTVWYLLDRRTIRRDGPYAFAPPPSPDLPVGIRAFPLAPGWYGTTWTGYVHQAL